MFRGRYEHALDSKSRLSVPSHFREVLSTQYDERLIITNFDQCLWAYPVAEWLLVEDKIAALPQFKEEVKALQRVFVSGATECAIDKSGRIVLPPPLRAYAGIERDVVIVGTIKRLEIWSAERWATVFGAAQDALGTMGDKLADLGL